MDWKEALSKAFESENSPQFEMVEEQNDVDSMESESFKVQKEPLKVMIDKKARKGKTATIIEGFTCDDEQLKEIAKELKVKVGVGGSSRCGEILLQGDCKQKVADILKEKGYKVKVI